MFKSYLPLLLWLMASYLLCLMPGPTYWDGRMQQSDSIDPQLVVPSHASAPKTIDQQAYSLDRVFKWVLNDHRAVKELGVHFVLMFGVAFCVMRRRFFSKKPVLARILLTLLFVGLVSVSIELLQELLPTGFARGFALSDIWVSLAGGGAGAMARALREKIW